MEALIIGIAASFNMLIIYFKLEKKRIVDAALDASLLFLLTMMFNQSTEGMVVATIASAIISLFLMIKNPKLPINMETLNKIDKKKHPIMDPNEWKERFCNL